MLYKAKNSKQQGDIGVAFAIACMTAKGWAVSVPLGDNQKYDLIVDTGCNLKRVQVKTSSYARNGVYEVALKTCGGNKSGSKTSKLDKANYDLLFVLTAESSCYLIPAESVRGNSALVLGKIYDEFKEGLGKSEPNCL